MKEKTQTFHMSKALQEKCDTLAELMADGIVREAKNDYAIGRVVIELMEDEDRYGKSSVKRAASEIACKPALLYAHATVARTWDEAQFDDLLDRLNGRGMPLSFSHLVELAKAETDEVRAALIEEAIAKSWSVRDLKNALQPARKSRDQSTLTAQFLKKCATTSKTAIERLQEDLALLDRFRKKGSIDRERMAEQVTVLGENCGQASKMYAKLEAALGELLRDDSTHKAAE